MSYAQFVPLRIFSSYTMLEGAIEPRDIAERAREHGFPAAAICDRNGLYGAMAFGDAAKKAGVQPIIGALLAVARPDRPELLDWLALYAQDAGGYENLCALVSAAHLARPVEQDAHVSFDRLAAHSGGLIALTAGAEGALARLLADRQQAAADDYCDRLRATFDGRLYVEIARRGNAVETAAEPHLIAMADGRGIPLVATNPACYADASFHGAHDAMLCIAASTYIDSDDRTKSCAQAWMKPAHDMRALFDDLPDAIANTLVVAQRCAVAAPARKPILPSLAGDPAAEVTQLRRDAHAGLVARLLKVASPSDGEALHRAQREAAKSADLADAGSGISLALDEVPWAKAYVARLDFELDVIVTMGFSGYFLIVADFIKWAKVQGIPVGPGRGSGAGSVVAWALTITDLDPLKLLPRLQNFRVEIEEVGDELKFLYKISPGVALKSYGVYAARLAGLPKPVVRRAENLLREYEEEGSKFQVSGFSSSSKSDVERRLSELDLNEISPVEALMQLYELQNMIAAPERKLKSA